MMNDGYVLEGRQIFSGKGKLVATLNDDGVPVMAPGMAGPHSTGVKKFLERKVNSALDFIEDPAAVVKQNLTTENPAPEQMALKSDEVEESKEAWEISTIPEDLLPPFSKQFGVNTPGFTDYVKQHKLSEAQIAALVKRLSK